MAHVFSRAWYGVTGDSYVVHATAVRGAGNPGAYMGKYLAKTFGDNDRYKTLGMKRRWSSSRGWPGSGRLRLEPSLTKDWKERAFSPRYLPMELRDPGTFTRVGNMAVLEYTEKQKRKGGVNRVKRLLNA